MLHLIGIIISLFLSTLLFTKKDKSKADFVLAFWLLLISFHLFTYYLLASGKFLEFPYFLGFEIGMPLLHGPFLFLYTALLTGKKIRKLHCFSHFLPAVAVYFVLSKFFLLPTAEKIQVYKNHGYGYTDIINVIHLAILPSGIVYIILSLFLLKQHRKNISNQVSDIEKINLNWLRNLTIGMCIIWLSILFGNDISTFTLTDFFILFIGYFGVKQVGIFTNKIATQSYSNPEVRSTVIPGDPIETVEMQLKPSKETLVSEPDEKIKYQKSAIGESLLLEIHLELTKLMQQEKLFKNPELSLNELAQQLKIHANALSQVINTLENKNFYDYINELRIQEFKFIVVLPENQKFTLLSLAYEVGFNSKTSFNRNFKKITGLSPTAYLKEEKIELQDSI